MFIPQFQQILLHQLLCIKTKIAGYHFMITSSWWFNLYFAGIYWYIRYYNILNFLDKCFFENFPWHFFVKWVFQRFYHIQWRGVYNRIGLYDHFNYMVWRVQKADGWFNGLVNSCILTLFHLSLLESPDRSQRFYLNRTPGISRVFRWQDKLTVWRIR